MPVESFETGPGRNEVVRVLQRQQSVRRMYGLFIVLMTGFAAVVVKLALIQIRDSDKLREIALEQYQSRESIAPIRGLILDRNLSILASNLIEYTLSADPSVIDRPDTVAAFLAGIVPDARASVYLRKLSDTTRRYVVLEKRLGPEVFARFGSWKCYGVRMRPTPRRHYNFDGLAGALIGHTNSENLGQSGIELGMNEELAGKPGFIVYQRDANGRRRPEVDYPHKDPVNGRSVVLTLDQSYQAIAEEELQRGIDTSDASSGRCIILQPRTGEILALTNWPNVNPNRLGEYSAEEIAASKNRIITDVYEPGSTFKLVAMSAALNEGIFAPNDVLSAEHGEWHYSANQKPIRDDHPADRLSLRNAFIKSSNIISAKLAEKLGAERFYKYARNYGFGIRTGIEAPGEVRGELRKPTEWSGITLKYLAFGYGLSVTALQIACAYAAIANDGVLMRPFLRRWLLDENRNIVDETVPMAIRRVVSSETAATMRGFMQGVVDSGTARLARIEGMSIGGKTGTSQRIVGSTYSSSSHVASFVGFFPVEDPKILILVILDEPRNGYYGGLVAAPIFREIALRIINSTPEFAKRPEPLLLAQEGAPRPVPDLAGMHPSVAGALLRSHGFKMESAGTGTTVVSQNPSARASVIPGSVVRVTLGERGANDAMVTIPDFTGLSIRQASARARAAGLVPSPMGSGVIVDQIPRAGTVVPRGLRVTLSAGLRHFLTANPY